MNYDFFFLKYNGFKIRESFSEIKNDLIKRIRPDSNYFFELFEHKNLFYIIPISKKIFIQSNFFKTIYGNKNKDNFFPLFGSYIAYSCSKYAIDGFFNIDYFVKTVIKILYFLNREKFSVGLLSFNKEPESDEKEFIESLLPEKLLTQQFVNTHQVLFQFFGCEMVISDGKNVAHYILGKLFQRYNKIDEKFIINYFGFNHSADIGANLDVFEKKIENRKNYDLNLLLPVLSKNEKETNDHQYYQLEFSKTNETRNSQYLKFNFMHLDFEISHHVLLKKNIFDETLWAYDKFFIVDGIFCTKYYPFNIENKYPKDNNLNFSEKDYNAENQKNIHSISFFGIETISEDFNNFFNLFEIKNIFFSNALINIGDFFSYATSIKILILPNSLKYIGHFFCSRTDKLIQVNLPESLIEIGDYFLSASSIEKITLPKQLKKIGCNFMDNSSVVELIIPDSIDDIGERFLAKCQYLREIKIPKNLKIVKNNFMCCCHSLVSIELSGVLTIGDNFLNNCEMLCKIIIPESVLEIGTNFMNNCYSLKIIEISCVKKIKNSFLNNCTSLEKIIIPESVIEIGDSFLNFNTENSSKISEVVLPKTLVNIGKKFLLNASSLKSLVLPKNLQKNFLEEKQPNENFKLTLI